MSFVPRMGLTGPTARAGCLFHPLGTGCCGGGGNYVAIAQNSTNCAISSTGTSWAFGGSLPNANNWLGFAYGNGTFAVAAYGSSVGAYSTNGGTNWLTSTMPAEDWRAIAFGNNLFVAIPAYSTNAVYSGNGINWTNAAHGLPDAGYWQALTYGNGPLSPLWAGPMNRPIPPTAQTGTPATACRTGIGPG